MIVIDNQLENNVQNLQKYTRSPWIRYTAKYIDIMLFAVIGTIILSIIDPQLQQFIAHMNKYASSIALLFFWMVVETILLWVFGTTPGKSLLNVKVKTANGSRISFLDSLTRSIGVWGNGMGIGLPIISFVALYSSYCALKKKGVTSWDERCNLNVAQEKIGFIQGFIAFILISGMIFLICYGIYTHSSPTN